MEYHPETPAIVLMQLADDVSKIQSLQSHTALIPTHSEKYKVAQKIVSASMLRTDQAWIEDVLWVGFEHGLIETIEEVIKTAKFCRSNYRFAGTN